MFCGPTISPDDVRSHLDCVCLPPVSHGDIIQVMADKPRAIGIIDGYFEGAPSVWHKEILYALDQGVHVFGASSMGALRAAELDVFGMVGVGEIYEWYLDGVIEDDDEVAVQHGPAEVGFVVASEPMVNIRATLASGLEAGVLHVAAHDLLVSFAKGTFYKERSWRGLLAVAEGQVGPEMLAGFTAWLGDHAIDLKRRDAVAMLQAMAGRVESFSRPFASDFRFEWTHVWDRAWRSFQGNGSGSSALSELEQRVLDEVRLRPAEYLELKQRAIAGWLSAHSVETDVGLEESRAALAKLRQALGLGTRQQLLAYMKRNGITEEGLGQLMEQRARVAQREQMAQADQDGICGLMIGSLKEGDAYADYVATVERKASEGVYERAEAGALGIGRLQLLRWYIPRVVGAVDMDRLSEHVSAMDLEGLDAFYRLVGSAWLVEGEG